VAREIKLQDEQLTSKLKQLNNQLKAQHDKNAAQLRKDYEVRLQ
jgi:hypothetical protein